MRLNKIGEHLASIPWLADVAAFLGSILYFIQSWGYAHTQTSIMDEGNYLYKGYLFVSGKYWPFQDFGPLTNHMPLAFLIPGYIQKWFGFGIRTGRYFAVVLGVLTLLGLWVVTRRLGSRWWAAVAVWAVALNPMFSKLYSTANSQVLIAFLLIWTLVFTLGEGRSLWQLILGAVIAGVILLTRINMAPVLPILLVYIWWQHGLRACKFSALAGLVIVAIGHAIFWPDILKLWATWLPPVLTPFLEPWREAGGGALFWNPIFSLRERFESFIWGIRLYFIPLVATLSVWLLWPSSKSWKNKASFRIAVFLSVLFGTLFLLHAWASIGLSYCVYCFRRYLAYFSPLGIVLFVCTFDFKSIKLSRTRQVIIISTIMIFYVLYMQSRYYHIRVHSIVDDFLSLKVPRIQSMRILPGTSELWILFLNKFGVNKDVMTSSLVFVVILGAGLLFLGVIYIGKRIGSRISSRLNRPFASLVLIVLLALGMLLSPTEALGAGYHSRDCSGNVIAAYEQAGERLAAAIPADASVFWNGGLSSVPLIYIPEARIFPAQLNGNYSFRLGGDPDLLSKFGLWNQDLAIQWWLESDYLLIEEQFYNEWVTYKHGLERGVKFYKDLVRSTITSGEFVELEATTPTLPCRPDSKILIFRRQP